MKQRKITTRMITVMALLIAMMVVCTRFISIETATLRVSVTFIPEAVMAILFGPFWSSIGGLIADTIGMILFPKGAYFPGFSLNAIITGAIYGFFYYKKELTWTRIIIATLLVTVIVHFFLTPLWTSMMGYDPFATYIARIITNVIFFPIRVVTTYYLGRELGKKKILTKVRTTLK